MQKLKPLEIVQTYAREMTPIDTGVTPKIKKLSGIRAVLFDVYGTLFQSSVGDISLSEKNSKVDREAMIRESIEAAGHTLNDRKTPIAELFLDTVRAQQDIRRDEGIDFPEIDILGTWEDLLGQLEAYDLIGGRVTKYTIKLASIHYESRVNACYPMPGVPETIEGLLDKDLSLGIVSNAQSFTPLLFDGLLDDSPHDLGFEEILCIWSYEHRIAKPSKKLYEVAAERLQVLNGIKPEEALFIGNDIRNDIWPSQALGFKTALFAGDQRSLRLREDDEDCKDVEPDLVITELPQLLEAL